MRKILKTILYGFFVLVIFSNLLTLSVNGFKKCRMNTFGFQVSEVISESMVPVLKVGDHQICKITNFDKVKKGDIILYEYGDLVIVHRVFQKVDNGSEKYLITKGDNNDDIDPWRVYPEDIISEVILNIPTGK